MSDILPFAKPKDREGKETISLKHRAELKRKLYFEQRGLCCTCGRRMTLEPYYPNTATLGHRNPEPMGCQKRDNLDNILGAQCFSCNSERGSKRDATATKSNY